jgi:hypothetical protein
MFEQLDWQNSFTNLINNLNEVGLPAKHTLTSKQQTSQNIRIVIFNFLQTTWPPTAHHETSKPSMTVYKII